MSESPFPYDGPAEHCATVVDALRRVVDPEVGLSIVDLGLVYGVQFGTASAAVQLTMTSAACPLGDLIVSDAEQALAAALPPGTAIDVTLVWDPPWTPERMSDRARQLMRW